MIIIIFISKICILHMPCYNNNCAASYCFPLTMFEMNIKGILVFISITMLTTFLISSVGVPLVRWDLHVPLWRRRASDRCRTYCEYLPLIVSNENKIVICYIIIYVCIDVYKLYFMRLQSYLP